jgi:hypothetical protein
MGIEEAGTQPLSTVRMRKGSAFRTSAGAAAQGSFLEDYPGKVL